MSETPQLSVTSAQPAANATSNSNETHTIHTDSASTVDPESLSTSGSVPIETQTAEQMDGPSGTLTNDNLVDNVNALNEPGATQGTPNTSPAEPAPVAAESAAGGAPLVTAPESSDAQLAPDAPPAEGFGASAPKASTVPASSADEVKLHATGVDAPPAEALLTTSIPDIVYQVVERPRSDQLWFHDGNIIIQAPEKQYRVHQSVLALHSTFFKDMFALPGAPAQGNQLNPMLDGCPVVEVPDAAADWDAVLSIIYHTWEKPSQIVDHIFPVDVMLAMLRLGHKYDFERIRTDALNQLKSIFPADMKTCDALYSAENDIPHGKFTMVHLLHICKLITAAEGLGIETVLPTAYAMVLRHILSSTLLFEGRDLDDAEPILRHETQLKILKGDRSILSDSNTFLFSWLRAETTPSGDECQFPENCLDELLSLLREDPGDFPGICGTSRTVLAPLSVQARARMSGLCIPCFNAAVAAYDRGRVDMFDHLPSYFGMRPRGELEDFYIR